MTIEEAKNQIISGLNSNSIQVLVQRLAEVLTENETLKAKINALEVAALDKKATPPSP